jgi:miniconductance mechanosensitive channel
MTDSIQALFDAQPLWMQTIIGLAILGVVVLTIHLIVRPFVLRLVKWLVNLSPIAWDGTLFQHHVPHRLSLLVPLIVMRAGFPMVPGIPESLTTFVLRLVSALMILVVVMTLDALLSAAHTLYMRTEMAATRPIKSYVQLVKLLMFLLAAVFIVARLADQSPWFFVSGLGAMMAIILLIFRDTLLSLVASIQLTNNDLVRVGDWIEMPQFGADGDVVDISLASVKVVNWDKTFTIIPTHKFLDNSFKNWRGMFELGGRRIKRAISINISTIRFLRDDEIERFSKFVLLKDYIAAKVKELEEYNEPYADDPDAIVNARRLTNVGTLRAYIAAYLRNHPKIHQNMTLLVRQLAPTPEGLPIEIYVFTNDTRWAYYEGIQADIFDHILAMVEEFDLEVYQRPSGRDLGALLSDSSG